MSQFVPGVESYIDHTGDGDVGVGLTMGCHQCGSCLYPKKHRVLPGLQWTCDHATWGPVTYANLVAWKKWFYGNREGAPYWCKFDDTFQIPADGQVLP